MSQKYVLDIKFHMIYIYELNLNIYLKAGNYILL